MKCPRCNSSLIKKINFGGVLYSCINTDCSYSRDIEKGNPIQILETNILCFKESILISENYTIHISQNGARQNRSVLEIHADEKTFGTWQWYLESLMCLGKYNKDQIIQDRLYLDWKQGWYVTGMLKAYQEIINSIVLKGITI